MKFVVMLREGASGNCRIGEGLTADDAPGDVAACVTCGGAAVAANNGLIVICEDNVDEKDLLDLIQAGYAVQVRDVYWQPVG